LVVDEKTSLSACINGTLRPILPTAMQCSIFTIVVSFASHLMEFWHGGKNSFFQKISNNPRNGIPFW
jgi:hypothetical protein